MMARPRWSAHRDCAVRSAASHLNLRERSELLLDSAHEEELCKKNRRASTAVCDHGGASQSVRTNDSSAVGRGNARCYCRRGD